MQGDHGLVLVTGAAGGTMGGTGRILVEMLLKQGVPVRALVRNDDDRAAALRTAGAEVCLPSASASPLPNLTLLANVPCNSNNESCGYIASHNTAQRMPSLPLAKPGSRAASWRLHDGSHHACIATGSRG